MLTYSNGNLVKRVETNSKVKTVSTIEYEYDNKNNPLKNILGYSLLIDHLERQGSLSSVNNPVKYSIALSDFPEVYIYTRELVYDANGYPSKISHFKNNGKTPNTINEYTY